MSKTLILMSILSTLCFLPTGLISLWFSIKAQRSIIFSYDLDKDYYYKRKMAILFALLSFLGFFIMLTAILFFILFLKNVQFSDLKETFFVFFG
jgi:hypothetical protein